MDDNSCLQNLLSCSQLSTVSTMSESSTPTFVYKRRKIQRNPAAVFPVQASTNTRPSDNCPSACSSEAVSVAAKEHADANSGSFIAPSVFPVKCNGQELASKSGSVDGGSLGHEPAPEDDPKSDLQKGLDLCGLNDSCSSSKSNVDLGPASLKPEVDDAGECSSSGAPLMDGLQDDLSQTDLCISLLRSHGVVKGVSCVRAVAEHTGCRNDSTCLRSCKICDRSEMTLNMLICDHCEEAFHVSCCIPRIKNINVDEWFCTSCLRKKLKQVKETSSCNSQNLANDSGRQKNLISKDELGPIAFMLRDTDPYTMNVRIGEEFQAEVPEWSGPIAEEIDYLSEPLEMNLSECASYRDWTTSKPSRLGSIGNWLQCQEIIDGDGTICGKWRRAPLFEVQTDNWECFRSVLWDPKHSDCAVPQELDTEQVLKHLKYIEMLRPRLAAKKGKLCVTKGAKSQELTVDLTNTRTS